MQKNDSYISPYEKVKITHYHLWQLNWPLSQISLQRIMYGFLVDGHN